MRKSVPIISAVAVLSAAAAGTSQAQAAGSASSSRITSAIAAAKIWYRALTVHMTSSTDYQGARTATLNAADDLYGVSSTQDNTVAAAWSAVTVS